MDETRAPQTLRSWFRGPRARWAVPTVVAVVAAGAVAVPALASAGADDLPDVTPVELLADVVQADPVALSGTVVYTARLGLPELPLPEADGAGPLSLLAGSSTVRVWSDGAERSRIAMLGTTSEFSMVRDGFEAWTYSSAENAVVHYAPAAEDAAMLERLKGEHAGQATPPVGTFDPEQLARMVLTVVEASSNVSMDADTTVAGRAAYQLVVTPTTDETLIGRIVVAVDGETSMPLRLQVWSTEDSGAPAVEIGYTDLSLEMPDDAALQFSVPVGATVREVELPVPDVADLAGLAGLGGLGGLEGLGGLDGQALPEGLAGLDLGDLQGMKDLDPAQLQELTGLDPAELERIGSLEGPERLAALSELMAGLDLEGLAAKVGAEAEAAVETAPADAAADGDAGPEPRLLGSGWGTVVEIPVGAMGEAAPGADVGPGSDDAAAHLDLLRSLGTQVEEGSIITSALLTVLVTDDGRILVGPVPADTLRALA